MTHVIGRDGGDGPVARLGCYRARDGSRGAALSLDVDGPHAATVVGKRGYGKSYTLGVLAEELAATAGVAPVVVDPMGVFPPMAEREAAANGTGDERGDVPATVVDEPTVSPAALQPRSWCSLVGLSPDGAAGTLVWRAAEAADTVDGMCDHVRSTDADPPAVRAATNHLAMARRWGVFEPDGLDASSLATDAVTVLDLSGVGTGPANAVCRVVADALYRARVAGRVDRLPWLLVDEAHAFFDGVAADGLRTLLTRGRAPGVSLVAATQRPSALPPVCFSQSDLVVAHRLTSERDLSALAAARPTYMDESFDRRMPTEPGSVVVVDDETETVHAARIRERQTPHAGDSPSARDNAPGSGGDSPSASDDCSNEGRGQPSPSSGL